MIELIDKLKSKTLEGKVCDYAEVDGVPILEADLTATTLTANTYYKHTGETGTYTTGVIYYYNGSSLNPIDGNQYTLPLATSSAVGGIKSAANRTTSISPTTGGTTSGRYYGVELDNDGTAFVNVPWTDKNPTDYYWANVKVSSSSSNTTFPRFQTMRARNTVYGLARGLTTSTPTATILHTGIKWSSGSYMPVLHFTGYAYGLQSPVEFKVGFYIYNDKIGYCGATNMGAWKPEIRLFRETRDSVDYVAVALIGSCYYLGLSVGIQEEKGSLPSTIDLTSSKWSFEFLTTYTTDDIPNGNTPPHATCCTVPYKQILNSLGKINFKLAGTTKATYTGGDTSIDFNVPEATTSASGLMTSAMVTKLNGVLGSQEVEDIIDEQLDQYVMTQSLTEAMVDLSAYGFVQKSSTEDTYLSGDVYAPNVYVKNSLGTYSNVWSKITELSGDIQTVDDNLRYYVPTNSTSEIGITSSEAMQLKGKVINITADFGDIKLLSGDGCSLTLSDVATFSGGVWATQFYEGDTPLSGKYATINDLNAYVYEQDLTQGLIDLSAYGFATETYVANAVSALVGGAPETLNALNELAAALGNDPNFATTMATELGKKQPTITGGATTITSNNLTASRALVSDANGKVAVSAVTSTELGYLDGVTSAIQTQLNGTVKLAGAQTITGDKTTTGLFKIQNGAAGGSFVLGADVNAKTLTANTRKLGRMGVPSYDSTTKTMAGISFDSQANANYADFGGHPNNAASIAPDVIRFTVANSHTNAINGARSLALQISKQAGLADTAGGVTSVAGAKFFIPVIVDGNLSATSLTENGTALSSKYLGISAKASSATVADSANSVTWANVSGKPTFATVATSGSYNDLSNKPTIPTSLPASDVYDWAKAETKPSYAYSEITGKPTLATVATSGSYNDLTNKPTIPSAYTLPVATSSARGGIKIGYSASGANIPLQLSSEKAYVALTKSAVTSALGYTPPETDTTYSVATASKAGLVKPVSVITKPTLNSVTTTAGKYYQVQMSSDGNMFVNVPWQAGSSVDLSSYATLASPAFTGTPTAPTPSVGTNNTQIATTAFVKSLGYVTSEAIDDLVDKQELEGGTVDLSAYNFAGQKDNPNLTYYATDNGTTTAGTWLGKNDNVTALFDGLSVNYKVTKAGASTTTFNLNGLGAKTVYLRGTTKLTTHYEVGTIVNMIYNSTTGAWYVADYDANSYAYLRQYYTLTTTDGEYPIIYSYTTATGTSSYKTAYGAVKGGFTFNPSTDTLSFGGLKIRGDTRNIHADGFVTLSSSNDIGDTAEVFVNATEGTVNINADTNINLNSNVNINGTLIGFQGLDLWYDTTSNTSVSDEGITWSDQFGFMNSAEEYTHTGLLHNKVPIVAGDNVSFTVDEENQVVKINATGGGSTQTYLHVIELTLNYNGETLFMTINITDTQSAAHTEDTLADKYSNVLIFCGAAGSYGSVFQGSICILGYSDAEIYGVYAGGDGYATPVFGASVVIQNVSDTIIQQ